MGMNFRKGAALFFAGVSVFLLVMTDFFWPEVGFITGVRQLLQSLDHPGPVNRSSTVRMLHSAGFLANSAAAVLVLYAFPQRVGFLARQAVVGKRMGWHFLIGLAVSLALTGVIILSVFTPFTFPLAALMGLILFMGMYLGSISILFRLAHDFLSWSGWQRPAPVLAVGYGILIFSALTAIPFVGSGLWLVLALLGNGAAFSSRFGCGKRWTLRPLFEELEK